ncbi:hypothetical protein [Streptomyces jumonjinensis]|uniref:hypothetical protein n=1 Tax=Streptomyces jumonjinensis TaxID=1945 RepID=UPI0037BD36F1
MSTPANVLALARLVLDATEPRTAAVLAACDALCRAWMPTAYDLILYCRDRFDQKAGGDRMREKVLSLQDEADHAVYQACEDTGVPILEVPTGMRTAERVQWIAKRVTQLGITAI